VRALELQRRKPRAVARTRREVRFHVASRWILVTGILARGRWVLPAPRVNCAHWVGTGRLDNDVALAAAVVALRHPYLIRHLTPSEWMAANRHVRSRRNR
jgi:hypothetical protein